MRKCLVVSMLILTLVAGCAPATSTTTRVAGDTPNQTGERGAPKTLMFGVRYELPDIAPKITTGTSSDGMKRLFTASLAYMDGAGAIKPYLAETLPTPSTDSWSVSPDGRMQTTYKLRPNLTWHDGHPLTADDFVFALRVYKSPGTSFDPVPQDRIEEVLAPDPRTVVIRWSTLYPEAGALRSGMFEPLPRHVLESAIEQQPDEISSLTYWSRDFVQAGPFRLERWEPGSHMDAAAFDGHALGRPKIDRIVVKFVPDENTMLTALLAESVQMAADNSLRFEHSLVLKNEWGPTNKGTVLVDPVQQRMSQFQLRPEYANPPALLDLRVRRAIAHAHDRQAIVDGLFSGEVAVSDSALPPRMPYFADLDRAITKYPYDLKRTEQLLTEAGMRRTADGAYLTDSGERFGFESWVLAGSQNEQQGAIMGDSWRRAGFDVKEHVIPTAQSQDGQVRATYPAVSSVTSFDGEINYLNAYVAAQVPSAANRWRGLNRGGWVSSEYEALWDAYNSTLDRSERNRQVIDMMKVATDQLPAMFNFHNPRVTGFMSSVRGPALGTPDSLMFWNVYEWELS